MYGTAGKARPLLTEIYYAGYCSTCPSGVTQRRVSILNAMKRHATGSTNLMMQTCLCFVARSLNLGSKVPGLPRQEAAGRTTHPVTRYSLALGTA